MAAVNTQEEGTTKDVEAAVSEGGSGQKRENQSPSGLDLSKLGKSLKRTFNPVIQDNSITLRNVVVAASTYGLERLLNAGVFHCPENGYRKYGFAFLFGPVFILFCVNLLVIGEVWKLSSRMHVKRYRRRGELKARVLPSILKACVGPAVWLIVAFLEEDYYLCATIGPHPRKDKDILDRKQKEDECKSQSHLLAWVILVTLVALGTVMIIWKRCYLKDNLLMENLYFFERREALSAQKTFKECMNAGKPFTERMGGPGKEPDLDNDPRVNKHGKKDHEKVTLYEDGIPETIGRKTVEEMFEGYRVDEWKSVDKWHYIMPYEAFKEKYPRISTGSPLDPWVVVQGNACDSKTQKKSRGSNCSSTDSVDRVKPASQRGDVQEAKE
ncbi:Protein FAM26E [Stylophora pistillata]|uniref:Protein FAM26E n=1 Tax=Stylophora pistillata TaxID=50429 RepID=A0A2B4S011_STYPI|nr:Protein FAM26E [Stylophora pistillata]